MEGPEREQKTENKSKQKGLGRLKEEGGEAIAGFLYPSGLSNENSNRGGAGLLTSWYPQRTSTVCRPYTLHARKVD